MMYLLCIYVTSIYHIYSLLLCIQVQFLRRNRHPCIIDIHDGFVTAQPRVLNIVMSYCEAGDLGKVVAAHRKNKTSVPEGQAMKWTLQIALALHFLHENSVIHR